ncbi:MAG: signal peptidase II [Firmicutes bacterium]|nr:signal peptidase II [Bacillota bacterium]
MTYFFIAGLVFISDRLSKLLVVSKMAEGESIPLISPVLYLTHVQNKGAAFGLLQGKVFFLSALAILCVILVLTQWRKIMGKSAFVRWGVTISIVGALGNLIDRLSWGAVVDFIDFRIFPIFNIADIAIVFGVGLLFWEVLFCDRPKNEDA